MSDSELICLAVALALLGFASEARWLRFAHDNLTSMFPYLPKRPGYNKRLRAALPLVKKAIRLLATDTDFWFDNHWIVDSTPVPCGMSRPTVKRSNLAGWAGYCASHSRFYWGLRLFLVCTPTGMPITWALANPKIDERDVMAAMLDREPELAADRAGLLLIADKGFASKEFEADLAFQGVELLRHAVHAGEAPQGRVAAEVGAAADRVGQRHVEGPARSRTARRPDLRGRRRPRCPAHPRDGHGHLAQPQDRRSGPAIADRFRSLTTVLPAVEAPG
ncbi:transposase [Streptomyces sp. NPDC019890]|uniref:transposase n=1 Tax=Streptomyces sp. NPDC019890 TaxID=3365064 RepID=UPI003851386E